jgi:excisionase family DNA binding protein
LRQSPEGLFHPVTTGTKGVAIYDRTELDDWRGLNEQEQKAAREAARSQKPSAAVMTRNAVMTIPPVGIETPEQAETFSQVLSAAISVGIEPFTDYLSRIASALENREGPELLTPEEVAERLKLKTRTVLRLVREGKLSAVRIGRLYRFRPADLRSFIEGL